MRWALFYHSLISDWNHGNAHFLRGVVSELLSRGEEVTVYEPIDGWSRQNLLQETQGRSVDPLAEFQDFYPGLTSSLYRPDRLRLERVLEDVDVVVAHEWNDPELIRRLGAYRKQRPDLRLLFHDTHHRSLTAPADMQRYDLRHFDGVLAYGDVIREIYLRRGWHANVWTWHEAADVRRFRPLPHPRDAGDLVWIGNWGDEERTEEISEFLLQPISKLKLRADIHGVRYPASGREALAAAGANFRGWLPNYRVPEKFARFSLTVHVPRRPYREQLPGIPTIRVFEALACGIPLLTAPWDDAEQLFRPGQDYLIARDGSEMTRLIRELLADPPRAQALAASGRESILARHTCGHRVDQLMDVLDEMGAAKKQRPITRSAAALPS